MPGAAAQTEAALGIRDMGVTWPPDPPALETHESPAPAGLSKLLG